ncbi:MAG: MMPL family transporter, partial [Methanomicrobiales archaeon]|nr:MMPL family transporter [Methanomicrobiales archaeon]
SVATLIRDYNGGVLPTTSAEVDAVVARIPEATLKSYLNGRMETVLQFSTVAMEMNAQKSFIEGIRSDIAWNDPPAGTTVTITGTGEMFTGLMDEIAESKTFMTLLGFAFILGFLLLVYRRIGAVSPLIPIAFVVGWCGAIMYLLGLDYTPLTAVLGSMSIGVASEYTIVIMERCEEELAKGVNYLEAIQTAVEKIGMAITVSGVATISGFAALTVSTFNIISNFGIVTVITIGFSLMGAILALPAVLSIMYRYTGSTRASTPAGAGVTD